jgi:NAD(P)-dependent dehydrogenase (short-subunit alcohol dehydrogenase family)
VTGVLIAGGATGIGRATAQRLLEQGVNVHIADIDEAGARKAVESFGLTDGRATVSGHDLAEETAPAAAVAAALDEHGGLDGLVVCAAMLVEQELDDFQVHDWDRTMALNLRAPFLLTQAAAPALRSSANGRVALIGSTAAFRGGGGSFAYAASKGGIVALTRSLAVALAPDGVCVNCVCPGWIETPFNDPFWSRVGGREAAQSQLESRIPLGAQGKPDDVASVIAFLVSPDARYVTGQSVVVDGGLLAS